MLLLFSIQLKQEEEERRYIAIREHSRRSQAAYCIQDAFRRAVARAIEAGRLKKRLVCCMVVFHLFLCMASDGVVTWFWVFCVFCLFCLVCLPAHVRACVRVVVVSSHGVLGHHTTHRRDQRRPMLCWNALARRRCCHKSSASSPKAGCCKRWTHRRRHMFIHRRLGR